MSEIESDNEEYCVRRNSFCPSKGIKGKVKQRTSEMQKEEKPELEVVKILGGLA